MLKHGHGKKHPILTRAAKLLWDHHGFYDQNVNELHTDSPLLTEAEIAARAVAEPVAPAAEAAPAPEGNASDILAMIRSRQQ